MGGSEEVEDEVEVGEPGPVYWQIR